MNFLYLKPLQKIKLGLILFLTIITTCNKTQDQDNRLNYKLPPIPDYEDLAEESAISVKCADTFEKVNIDIPITKGPYMPTYQSINKIYPQYPNGLAKLN